MEATTNKQENKLLFLALTGIVVVALVSATLMMVGRHKSSGLVLANAGQVSITSDGFSPAAIKVKKGSVVTWTNQNSGAAQIVADQPGLGLDSEESLEQGDAFSYKFTKAGVYTYHDANNASMYKGTVIVQ